jgi:predicted permease
VTISYSAWKRLFGGDANVLGRKIYLDYDSYVVRAVMPPEFRHPGATIQGSVDVWLLAGLGAHLFTEGPRTRRYMPRAIARLKPGMTVAEAQSRLDAFAGELRRDFGADYPAKSQWAPRITPLREELAGRTRGILPVLAGTVVLVLLVCCGSVANLLLAKACALRRELAIRAALGAGRSDLMRQLLADAAILALAAGAAGGLLAATLTPLLARLSPLELPEVNPIGMSATVMGFTVLVTLVTAILAGLAPAFQAVSFGVSGHLRDGGWGAGAGVVRARAQSALVIGQIAFSLVLMVGAGLLLRSFRNLLEVNPGFNPDRVLVASIWLPPPTKDANAVRKYETPAQRTLFVREVLRRMRALPGVETAAMGAGNSIPLGGWNASAFGLEEENIPQGESLMAQMTSISPDFMKALQLRLISGRAFAETDDQGVRVALIDEAMAKRFWKDRSPIGRRIRLGPASAPQWWTIVGVAGNMKTDAVEAPDAPHIYFSIFQRSGYGMTVFLRAAHDPARLAQTVRSEIRSVDPDLPVFAVRTMDEVVSRSRSHRRFTLEAVGGFALLTLLLAGLGVYGVVAFQVSQRRREIGIRIALGAQRGQVLAAVLRRGLVLTAWGLALGAAAAAALARFLESLLFGASSTDAITYIGACTVLVGTTLAASYLPASRAAETDPATALRAE